MFEEDIKDKVKNINLFEIVYKKDNFVLKGNEYPLGYTSYIAIQEECRFIDENLFKVSWQTPLTIFLQTNICDLFFERIRSLLKRG